MCLLSLFGYLKYEENNSCSYARATRHQIKYFQLKPYLQANVTFLWYIEIYYVGFIWHVNNICNVAVYIIKQNFVVSWAVHHLAVGPAHQEKLKLEEQRRAAEDKYKFKKRQIRDLQEDVEVNMCVDVNILWDRKCGQKLHLYKYVKYNLSWYRNVFPNIS